ncbi:apoptosis regulatory protein Siva [Maniola hyperantus]|uniref:apoptosis regulatory protein Siva n=1 Tax=Aphantopus hyperantus TaxID=2795564 RepID=UPI001569D64A|nr:apoptosis regulatory protein Siva-like [Maniola hyperantus]
MAKRSNPYIEDYIQQSKTHIGMKQYNNKEDRLKIVYEKTLQLLFQGAKKSQQHDLQYADISSTDKKGGMKFKQLFIGKDGGLLRSGTLATAKNTSEQHCSCRGLVVGSCGYCECALCAACQRQCAVCQLLYCSKCSLNGSEGTEICVSCYS